MDTAPYVEYKYQHGDRAALSAARRFWLLAFLAVALLGSIFAFPAGIALWLIPLVIYASNAKKLYIGPRYLVCGQAIVYYANVLKVRLDEGEGTLALVCANDRAFVLDRAKFPTNARKSDKIARNKALKFGKVADKLIERVRRASPAAEFSGIAKGQGASEEMPT